MTPEQQAMIEQAAINYANQLKQDGKKPNFGDTFTAGASFYEEKIMPGVMAEFAEWIDENGWVKTDAGHWSDYCDNRYTLEEVIKEFLSHLKHNQDAAI